MRAPAMVEPAGVRERTETPRVVAARIRLERPFREQSQARLAMAPPTREWPKPIRFGVPSELA